MRYGELLHEPKASEMSHGISHVTSEISDSSILSTATMATRKLNLPL